MPSYRIRRRTKRSSTADEAVGEDQWSLVASKARAVLAIEPGNEDANAFLKMAAVNSISAEGDRADGAGADEPLSTPQGAVSTDVESSIAAAAASVGQDRP